MPSPRVLNVYDNGALVGTDLIGSKGQGFIVDIDDERTLFDTGMRGRYLMHNLEKLRVDPESVDRVVLSHGHMDHTGGLPDFLEARETPVTVHAHPLFDQRKARGFKGLPYKPLSAPRLLPEQREKAVFRHIDAWTTLSDHMMVVTAPPLKEMDSLSERLLVKGPEGWTKDLMEDELSLALATEDGLVLVTGCCHRGILNLLSSVDEAFESPISAVVGGLHMGSYSEGDVDHMVDMLKKRHGLPGLYLNHCTGEDAVTRVRHNLGLDGVNEFYVGTELTMKTAANNIFIKKL